MKPVLDSYTYKSNRTMLCGSALAEEKTYRMIKVAEDRVWLVPTDGDPNRIQFHNPLDTKSEGYGGSVITFHLEDGSIYEAKGPWNSNPGALKKDTRIDLTQNFVTWGLVALERGCDEDYNSVFKDVLYIDKEPVKGSYNRIERMALQLAKELGRRVYYLTTYEGGSIHGPVYPTDNWRAEKDD